MAVDDGPSRVGDIAQRLNASANYTSQYRLRLIEAELIEPAGWGKIDFALPYLREYLREHAAIERPPDRG
jgi:Mn-dependent DtxR family transcriptional regulator